MSTTSQRRSNADLISPLIPRLENLQRRASLATRSSDVDDCEEEAQAIAADLVAVFRGPRIERPVNPPLFISRCGKRMGW